MDSYRNFFLLWQGLLISSLGSVMFSAIGVLWLTDLTQSANIIGSFLLTGGVVTAGVALFAGVVADRFNRRTILVITDLFCGLALLVLAGLFLIFDARLIIIIGIFAVYIVLSISAGFYLPAVFSLVPDLLPEERLGIGNSAIGVAIRISLILGRGLGGFLFVLMGASLLIPFIGICFLLSAISEAFIQVNQAHHLSITPRRFKEETKVVIKVLHDIQQGFSYIVLHRAIAAALLTNISISWFLGTLMVILPFMVQHFFNAELVLYGYLLAGLSAGSILGAISAGILFNKKINPKKHNTLLKLAVVAIPITYINIVAVNKIYMGALLLFLFGFFYSFTGNTIMTRLHMLCENEFRGRVLSNLTMFITLIVSISGYIGGIVIDGFNKNIVVSQLCLGAIGFFIVYLLIKQKKIENFIGFSVNIDKISQSQSAKTRVSK